SKLNMFAPLAGIGHEGPLAAYSDGVDEAPPASLVLMAFGWGIEVPSRPSSSPHPPPGTHIGHRPKEVQRRCAIRQINRRRSPGAFQRHPPRPRARGVLVEIGAAKPLQLRVRHDDLVENKDLTRQASPPRRTSS